MNLTLWILQALAVLLYGASAVMKIFRFETISADVRSFGALPRKAWTALGVLELACVLALMLPLLVHGVPVLPVAAAALLAIESLLFVWVHARYRETGTIVVCVVLGLLMAFLAYGRLVLAPIG